MRVLIVDDDGQKISEVSNVLREAGVAEDDIDVELCASRGLRALKQFEYDLLVLDLYLPPRLGEDPAIDGGSSLLKRVTRGNGVHLPEAIIGLSGNAEAIQDASKAFDEGMWRIELCSPSNPEWRLRLKQKVQYLKSRSQTSVLIDPPNCDVLFVCALLHHELTELHAATGGQWSEATFSGDPGLYFASQFDVDGRTLDLFSIKTTEMGLVAATATTCKAISLLRPSLVVMTGVCAGKRGDCELGDVIVASQTWDYGSGKFTTGENGQPSFSPSPIQIPAPARIGNHATAIQSRTGHVRDLYNAWSGWRPGVPPRVHYGPLASGAAVQNYPDFFSEVSDQHRKILGVDMEAFGVAWACHNSSGPAPDWLVVKAVSDFGDGTKDDRYHHFSSYMSARIALEFVRTHFRD